MAILNSTVSLYLANMNFIFKDFIFFPDVCFMLTCLYGGGLCSCHLC